MPEPGADRLVDLPGRGRTFSATRRARFGDLSPEGRLRLDALARFQQDVSSDDTTDAGLDNDMAWVVRRTKVVLDRSPRFRELLTLTTFCSGQGGRWAERRVSMTGDRGAAIEVVSLWVHLDAASGRPVTLPEDFHRHYDEAAQGRTVSARLQHDSEPSAGAEVRPWPLRATDFDLLGHVNNAATWAVVEDVLAAGRPGRGPLQAELEYRLAIEPGDAVAVASARTPDDALAIWITDPTPDAHRLYATALVR
jgi:acyl-ACP thioesterase